MAAIPICLKESREGRDNFLLMHSCSSAVNPVTWGDTIQAIISQWEKDPFDKAIRPPALNAHLTNRSYNLAFKFKSELPTNALYYLTKVLGTKKMKKDINELRGYVAQCKQIGIQFAYFMYNEWIFDNPKAMIL